MGGGWGFISEVVATFNLMGGSFNLSKCNHQGWLNNPSSPKFGLCAACWAQFLSLQIVVNVSHPFSFLNISLGTAGGKPHCKILSLSLDLSSKFCFSRLLSLYSLLSLFFLFTFFLLVGLLLQFGALNSVQGVRCRAAVSNDKST